MMSEQHRDGGKDGNLVGASQDQMSEEHIGEAFSRN